MKKKIQILAILILAISNFKSLGQNSIFLKNNTKILGKVKNYSENKFNILLDDNHERIFNEDKIIIFFNANGEFIYFDSDASNKDFLNDSTIANFYTDEKITNQDYILTSNNDLIFGKIKEYTSDLKEIVITSNADTKIYQIKEIQFLIIDLQPFFISDVYEAAPILNQKKINGSFENISKPKPQIKITEKPIAKSEKTITNVNPEYKNSAIISVTKKDNNSEVNDLSIFNDENTEKIKLQDSKILTEEQKIYYENQSKTNILLFKDKLKIIGNRNRTAKEKDIAIKDVLKLFESTATIEVSSINNNQTKNTSIEKYLRNLANLNYDKVEIEFVNLKFVSSLTKSNDGKYRGIVAAEQSFKGFRPNSEEPVYDDFVEKNYEVIVSSYDKIQNGNSVVNWKVLLGNVKLSHKK